MNDDELTLETPKSLLVNWKIPIFFHLSMHKACSLLSPYFQFGSNTYFLRLCCDYKIYDDRYINEFVIVLEKVKNPVPAEDVSYEIGLKSNTGREIEIDRRLEADKLIYYFKQSEVERERHIYFFDGKITVYCFMRLRKLSSTQKAEQGKAKVMSNYWHNISTQYSYIQFGELSLEFPQSLIVFWKIPNFFTLAQQYDYSRKSPEISFADGRYCLWLYPTKSKLSGEQVVSFKLVNVSDSLHKTDVSFEVEVKSSTGREITIDRNKPAGQLMLTQPIPSCEQLLLDREFSISRECIRTNFAIIKGDTVTVFCSLRLREPKRREGGTPYKEKKQEPFAGMAKLRSDYRELLEKGLESDACLVVGGKEFPAHKNILRARSSIFDAMFSHEMAERESGRVVIDDLDPENFGDFLEYLYTGVVGAGLSDSNVFGLYKAAHKYDVPTLKSECVAHMCRNMSVEFFCDAITLALQYNEKELYLKAIEFFNRKMAQIAVTEKWQQFSNENCKTANELLMKAMILKK